MVTPKFGRRPPPRKVPCIVHPPPDPLPPLAPGYLPLQLSAAARWLDLDPLYPNDQAAYLDLSRALGSEEYFGETQTGESKLGLRVTRTDPSGVWNVVLTVTHATGISESVSWNGVFIDPSKNFDSGVLELTTIPGMDYQFVKVLE
jgi:hypothetical protein